MSVSFPIMKKVLPWLLFFVVVIGGVVFAVRYNNALPSPQDDFAKCLKDRGSVFYGAFWCSHCQNQKALFGTSARYLPYVECSTPDGKAQTEECKQKKVSGYPLWEFADGSRKSGETSLQQLSDKTGCPLTPISP